MSKQKFFALLAALALPLALAGCSVRDALLYLYGGDDFVTTDETDYACCVADNGVTVVYDQNVWNRPTMAQADTVSLTAGNQLGYTAVWLQTTDQYDDYLAEAGAELQESTNTVQYDLEFTVPDAAVQAVRYDCGSYQVVLAQIDYDSGTTVYVTAATRSASYDRIVDLLQTVYPTAQTPESAADLLADADTVTVLREQTEDDTQDAAQDEPTPTPERRQSLL